MSTFTLIKRFVQTTVIAKRIETSHCLEESGGQGHRVTDLGVVLVDSAGLSDPGRVAHSDQRNSLRATLSDSQSTGTQVSTSAAITCDSFRQDEASRSAGVNGRLPLFH